jgi:hypothetical protein
MRTTPLKWDEKICLKYLRIGACDPFQELASTKQYRDVGFVIKF